MFHFSKWHGQEIDIFTWFEQTKLREGNVFTPVCDSVHRGSLFRGFSVQGGLCPGVSLSRGVSVQWVSVQGWQGVSVWGGGVLSRRDLCHGDPPGMMEERTVRILLECILVSKMFIHKMKVLFLEFHFKYTFYKRIE